MTNIAIATTLGTATTAAHRNPLITKTAAMLAMVTNMVVEIGGKELPLMVTGTVHRPKMRNTNIVCASLIRGKRVICAADYVNPLHFRATRLLPPRTHQSKNIAGVHTP